MDFDDIKIALARVRSLVEGWESAGVTELERDLALEELRRVYAEIRFGGVRTDESADEPTEESAAENCDGVAVPPAVVGAEDAADLEDDAEDTGEPETEVELIMSDEDFTDDGEAEDDAEESVAAEDVAQPAEVSDKSERAEAQEPEQPTAAEGVQSEAESVGTEFATTLDAAENRVESRKTEPSLFGDDEIVLSRSSRRRVIMSLYDDEVPTVVAERADKRVSEPASEQTAEAEKSAEQPNAATDEPADPMAMPEIDEDIVLGDVLRTEVHTLGESIARPKGIAESAPVESLRAAIGINDRFLLIRDLFGGDAAAYEKAMVAIDSFDNLDDCMVHIVENYSWRSTSDGAKLIMNLIQRKFRQ